MKTILDDYKSMNEEIPPRKGAAFRLAVFAILIFILGFVARGAWDFFYPIYFHK